MSKKTLLIGGIGVLALWLLTRNANAATTVGPSNAGGPGTLPDHEVYEADPAEVRQVAPSGSYGRVSDSGFGTGSATRVGDYGQGPLQPGEPYLAYPQETYR